MVRMISLPQAYIIALGAGERVIVRAGKTGKGVQTGVVR